MEQDESGSPSVGWRVKGVSARGQVMRRREDCCDSTRRWWGESGRYRSDGHVRTGRRVFIRSTTEGRALGVQPCSRAGPHPRGAQRRGEARAAAMASLLLAWVQPFYGKEGRASRWQSHHSKSLHLRPCESEHREGPLNLGMSSPLGMLPKKEEKRKKERYVAAGSRIKPNTP